MQSALTSPVVRRRAMQITGAILLALTALWVASKIPHTLTVFGIAGAVALALAPVVTWLEKRKMPRGAAIALVYLALLAISIVLLLAVVPATFAQVQSIATDTPAYITLVQSWIDSTQRFLAEHGGKNYLPGGYTDLRSLIGNKVGDVAQVALGSLSNVLVDTFTAAFIGFSSLVLSVFLVVRGDKVADSWFLLLPEHRRGAARELAVEMARIFGSYITGQVVVCSITGAAIFLLTSFTGFKFALLLGIVAGIAYAVPYVGQVVAHVVALLLAAPQGPTTVIWVQVIVFTVARISDNVIGPRVMSESVGVSPIVVMFSVFAGGELFGMPGLLLGIPAAALAKVVWRFFRAQFDPNGTASAANSGATAAPAAPEQGALPPPPEARAPA